MIDSEAKIEPELPIAELERALWQLEIGKVYKISELLFHFNIREMTEPFRRWLKVSAKWEKVTDPQDEKKIIGNRLTGINLPAQVERKPENIPEGAQKAELKLRPLKIDRSAIEALPADERDLATMLSDGLTDREIARRTGKSGSTISNRRVPELLEKLGLSRADLKNIKFFEILGQQKADPEAKARKPLLTLREKSVLIGVQRGMTNAEIGVTLGIVASTVGEYLRRIGEKLGVSGKYNILLEAAGRGIFSREDIETEPQQPGQRVDKAAAVESANPKAAEPVALSGSDIGKASAELDPRYAAALLRLKEKFNKDEWFNKFNAGMPAPLLNRLARAGLLARKQKSNLLPYYKITEK